MTMNIGNIIGKTVITKALAEKPIEGLVYFLHGPCDNGIGLQSWINKTINGNFAFKKFPVMYPSSPLRSYSLHGGNKENVWFDQLALSPNLPEDYITVTAVAEQLNKLIQAGKTENGIQQKNVIVGGFSMGGAMAIHFGYKFNSDIAGVFALSTFLPSNSQLYDCMDQKIARTSSEIKYGYIETQTAYQTAVKNVKFPKLFMSHGLQDPIVSLRWAKQTFNDLRKRGVDGHFYTMENVHHTVSKQQLGLLHKWIDNTLYKNIESKSSSYENE